LAVGACGGSSKRSQSVAPSPSAASSAPAAALPTYPRLTRRAFGMHWLDYRSPAMPRVSFGAVRLIGGNVVTWPMLQPTSSTPLDAGNPAVRQLDAMIALYHRRGVEPL